MENFSFSPPMNLAGGSKWLLTVTNFEATNSVFNITDENKSFSISILGRWRIPIYSPGGIIDKLKNLLKHRSQIDIELHLEEVRKKGNKKMEIRNKNYQT